VDALELGIVIELFIQAMFLVAMLTGRIFLIDSDNPVSFLSEILQPNLVDWGAMPSYIMDELSSEFLNARNVIAFALVTPEDFAIGVKPQVLRVLAKVNSTMLATYLTDAVPTPAWTEFTRKRYRNSYFMYSFGLHPR
jgi:hypothetical protein